MVGYLTVDGCEDHMNKKPDLISLKDKNDFIRNYRSQNFIRDSSGDCNTQ